MKKDINVKIDFEGTNMIHSIFGKIESSSFDGGTIEFSIYGLPEVGYDFFLYNALECEGFSKDYLPEDLEEFFKNLEYRGF